MSQIPPLVTQDGDINVLDRAGLEVIVTYSDEGGAIDISGDDVRFESGTLSLSLAAEGLGKKLVLSAADIDTIEAEKSNRFVIVNRTPTTPEPLWEGYIFIRTVG